LDKNHKYGTEIVKGHNLIDSICWR